MSYTPTNWKAGDVVTSAKLNKMEQGIAAGGGIRIAHLTISNDQFVQLDITPNELIDAFENGGIVVVISQNGSHGFQSLIANFYYNETKYEVNLSNMPQTLTSSDPDEYFIYDPNSSDDSGGGTIQ